MKPRDDNTKQTIYWMPDKTVEVYPVSPQGIQIDKEHSKQTIKNV